MPQFPTFVQALTGFILLILLRPALAEPAWHEHSGTDSRNRLIEGQMCAEGIESETCLEALARIQTATREDGIDRLLAKHEVDVLISPTGGPAWKIDWVNGDHDGGGSATPAAVSGYPAITVPMGTVHGLPVGLSFFAGSYSEPTLVTVAAAFEQLRPALPMPG